MRERTKSSTLECILSCGLGAHVGHEYTSISSPYPHDSSRLLPGSPLILLLRDPSRVPSLLLPYQFSRGSSDTTSIHNTALTSALQSIVHHIISTIPSYPYHLLSAAEIAPANTSRLKRSSAPRCARPRTHFDCRLLPPHINKRTLSF